MTSQKIEEAKTLHNKLSEIYAKSNLDPKQINEAKEILNHAYTYYKQAADEVKAHGQFVFEGTDRYNAYVSEFRSDIRKNSGSKTESLPTEEPLKAI
ncbi:MAG: hypothetical protein JXR91_08650 [Deltaproteobacteria bacterium]|nr:hypothetical protein [Deltaproteobacteria bacterium]